MDGNREKEALADYVSVENRNGKININTAPIGLIQALDERIGVEETQGIEEFRKDEDNLDALNDSAWFINYLPGDIDNSELQGVLTVQSSNFRVTAQARYQERRLNLEAAVTRVSEREMKILAVNME